MFPCACVRVRLPRVTLKPLDTKHTCQPHKPVVLAGPQDKKADAYAPVALLFTPTDTTLSFGNGFGNCIARSSEEASITNCFGGEHCELRGGRE